MRPTREGKRFFLATLLIALAAFNTGNNLIYLILSMMLSIFLLSIVILKINMRKLALKVSQDNPVYANTSSSISMVMANGKSIDSHSVRVTSSGAFAAEIYLPLVPARSGITNTAQVLFRKRGIYKYRDFFIESEYPFVFFRERILSSVEGEIIVYPEIKEIDLFMPRFLKEVDSQALSKIGAGEEFAMVREFRYGDDSRKIHWKASAKTEKLLVTEYSAADVKKLTLILDNLIFRDAELFEKAVSFSASLSSHFLMQGYFVRLMTCAKVIPFGIGMEHLFKILDILAVLRSHDSWECPLSVETEGLTILVLSSEQSVLSKFVPLSDMVVYAHLL